MSIHTYKTCPVRVRGNKIARGEGGGTEKPNNSDKWNEKNCGVHRIRNTCNTTIIMNPHLNRRIRLHASTQLRCICCVYFQDIVVLVPFIRTNLLRNRSIARSDLALLTIHLHSPVVEFALANAAGIIYLRSFDVRIFTLATTWNHYPVF
jgi:hypothetical protein